MLVHTQPTTPFQLTTAHHFTATLPDGSEVPLSTYAGKVLLVVNTASQCVLTPQYNRLKALQAQYAHDGLQVLAFPSADFQGQEFGSDTEIAQFCDRNFKLNFPLFSRVHVKGKAAHPLFRWFADGKANGKTSAPPRWNFHKYVIDRNGKFVAHYWPFFQPNGSRVTQKIEQLLAQ